MKLSDYINPIGQVAGAADAISGGINAVKSLFTSRKKLAEEADARQIKQQTALNEINSKTAKEMADYEQALKLKMWKDTNYTAQLLEAKKAGVSKAAVLGGSGAGAGGAATGATVDGAGIGTGASGGAENQQAVLNAELQKAQIRNINAQTAKTTQEVESSTFDNEIRSQVGTGAYSKEIDAKLASARQNHIKEYREANALMNVLEEGKGIDLTIDKFGQILSDNNYQQVAEAEVTTAINKWVKLNADIQNIGQNTKTSKSEEDLNKVEKDILEFKEDLTNLGLNETTVKIIELFMKAILNKRRR